MSTYTCAKGCASRRASEQREVRHGPRPACHTARRHHQVGIMSKHEPDMRSGWSFLGFLNDCISSKAKFRRLLVLMVLLMAFVLVLVLAYALAKGDVTAWYDQATQHAAAWAKYGIPPGGITLTLGAMTFFSHRKAKRKRRAAETKKAKKTAKKKELTRDGGTAKPNPKKPPD